ncbi:hypothetical protein ACHAQH_005620 [Verticillium albo-atrum]
MVESATSEPVVHDGHVPDNVSVSDTHSITTSQYDVMIQDELERTWILNLSMHFRDKSKREKFFVTYRDKETSWRRVTISLDYRNAPENSLEMDLAHTKLQREKSAKIYEAIRESLQDIQFYESVTNLKLQTTDGRLHVHVVEDVNVCPLRPTNHKIDNADYSQEIINYPTVRQVQHLGCQRIRERDIDFDSHMSGFVYKVSVGEEVLIKKEIPGPDTIDEFLYEINALNRLRYSRNVISFFGVVVDDHDECVKGLLISYAGQGALIDLLYDNRQDSELGTPWPIRERWARQIVEGLSDIHESGFVQGDFTLSNIVIDDKGDAKIIDINRRGCPVGWEPPEATPLIESGQRISMYIGVKSDLYQLGMVLWALATQEDEPEAHGRPLILGHDVTIPGWYRQLVEICLSDDPRQRLQAATLLTLFPDPIMRNDSLNDLPSISVDDGYSMQEYFVGDENGHPSVKTIAQPSNWSYVNRGQAAGYAQDPYYYTRGRSPPSPLPSHCGQFDSYHQTSQVSGWAGARNIAPSYSDVGADEMVRARSVTPRISKDSLTDASLKGEQICNTFDREVEGNVETPAIPSPLQALQQQSSSLIPEDKDELDAVVTPTPNTPVKEDQKLISDISEQSFAAQMPQASDQNLSADVHGPQGKACLGESCLQIGVVAEVHERVKANVDIKPDLEVEDAANGADLNERSLGNPLDLSRLDTNDTQTEVKNDTQKPNKTHEADSALSAEFPEHGVEDGATKGRAANELLHRVRETPIAQEAAPSTVEITPDAEAVAVDIGESSMAKDHGYDEVETVSGLPDGTSGQAFDASPITAQLVPVGKANGDDGMTKETGFTVPGEEIDNSIKDLGEKPKEITTTGVLSNEPSTTPEEKESAEQGENFLPSIDPSSEAQPATAISALTEHGLVHHLTLCPEAESTQLEEKEIFHEKCHGTDVSVAKTTSTITTDEPM